MNSENTRLRITHIVPRIHEEASGPTQSVVALCAALAGLGCRVDLSTLTPTPSGIDPRISLRVHGTLQVAYRFGISFRLWAAMKESAASADILHNHSPWMFPNIAPGLVTRPDHSFKLVGSPRGTLSPWAWKMSRWKKRVAWWLLGQRLTLTRAACFRATAESEYETILRLKFFRLAAGSHY